MDLKVDVKCPNCGRTLAIKAKEMFPGRSQNCPGCSASITFTGDDGRKVQKAMDELEKTLKKGINIRI